MIEEKEVYWVLMEYGDFNANGEPFKCTSYPTVEEARTYQKANGLTLFRVEVFEEPFCEGMGPVE